MFSSHHLILAVPIGCGAEAFVFGTLADFGCGVLAEEADGEAAQEREVGCTLSVAQFCRAGSTGQFEDRWRKSVAGGTGPTSTHATDMPPSRLQSHWSPS